MLCLLCGLWIYSILGACFFKNTLKDFFIFFFYFFLTLFFFFFLVGEDGEKTDVLHIKSIKSISHDSKQRVKIELKNDHKISFFLRRSDAEVLEEALGFGGKHEGEKEKKKGKRGGGGGVKDPKVGSEEGFAIPSGLTGGDFRRLTEVGEVQNVEKVCFFLLLFYFYWLLII